jgi:hypothetical protein
MLSFMVLLRIIALSRGGQKTGKLASEFAKLYTIADAWFKKRLILPLLIFSPSVKSLYTSQNGSSI